MLLLSFSLSSFLIYYTLFCPSAFHDCKFRFSSFKPTDRTHSVFGGRSFAPKDLAGDFSDDVDAEEFVTSIPQELRDSVFFDFHHDVHDAIAEEPSELLDELDSGPPPLPERASSPAL